MEILSNCATAVKAFIIINSFVLWVKRKIKPSLSIDELKKRVHILFVDDERFNVVNILKKQLGWEYTSWVKDVKSLDMVEIRDAHIIFVDINGVGKSLFPTDEGLGLVNALVKKYPKKKIVVYSAQSTVPLVHKAPRLCSDVLPKGAEPYEFQKTVEALAVKLEDL